MRASTPSRAALSSALLLLAYSLTACANRAITMTPATSVPAATATLKVGQDKNGNTTVDLRVEHLAEPGRLTPPAQTYVVWLQASDQQPQNQGQLRVGSDLSGRFQTVTPAKQFDLFVTAENDPSAMAPSGQEVLRQQISRG